MKREDRHKNILAIDCCDHVVAALKNIIDSKTTTFFSKNNVGAADFPNHDTDLIVIGVSNIPVRRLFISRLRRFYPEIPMLVLRRETMDYAANKTQIRGEFILSDNRRQNDLELVRSIREILPLKLCHHLKPHYNYDLVREVTRVIAENYSDPDLNLNQVAQELPTSPSKLSRILNKEVGISFRQLVRHIRIEEAKRMLASHQYSIKEVSARVGFNDSHYFSRSFKEMTGLNATEYEHSPNDSIFS